MFSRRIITLVIYLIMVAVIFMIQPYIMFDEDGNMKKFGYKLRDTYGVVAAGGTLGILIPPSGPLILYGVVSETSIGALFIAGLLPGLLLAFVFALYCVLKNLNTEGSKKQA